MEFFRGSVDAGKDGVCVSQWLLPLYFVVPFWLLCYTGCLVMEKKNGEEGKFDCRGVKFLVFVVFY